MFDCPLLKSFMPLCLCDSLTKIKDYLNPQAFLGSEDFEINCYDICSQVVFVLIILSLSCWNDRMDIDTSLGKVKSAFASL